MGSHALFDQCQNVCAERATLYGVVGFSFDDEYYDGEDHDPRPQFQSDGEYCQFIPIDEVSEQDLHADAVLNEYSSDRHIEDDDDFNAYLAEANAWDGENLYEDEHGSDFNDCFLCPDSDSDSDDDPDLDPNPIELDAYNGCVVEEDTLPCVQESCSRESVRFAILQDWDGSARLDSGIRSYHGTHGRNQRFDIQLRQRHIRSEANSQVGC